MPEKRFESVSLSFNVGIPSAFGKFGNLAACNSGGSVICTAGTGGCGAGGLTCVGTSCSGASATVELNFDAVINVAAEQLEALKKELTGVVAKFTR